MAEGGSRRGGAAEGRKIAGHHMHEGAHTEGHFQMRARPTERNQLATRLDEADATLFDESLALEQGSGSAQVEPPEAPEEGQSPSSRAVARTARHIPASPTPTKKQAKLSLNLGRAF